MSFKTIQTETHLLLIDKDLPSLNYIAAHPPIEGVAQFKELPRGITITNVNDEKYKWTDEDMTKAITFGFMQANKQNFIDLEEQDEFYAELKQPQFIVEMENDINNCNSFNIEIGCIQDVCTCGNGQRPKFEIENGIKYICGRWEK